MEEKEDTPKPVITREEEKFIEENIDPKKTRVLIVEGMLLRARRGEQTLDEILEEEMTRKHEGPDQLPLHQEAYNFLKENGEYFNLKGES